MKPWIRLPLAVCGLLLSGLASGQTATNVDCTGCVQEPDLANGAVTSAKIATGGVKGPDIATDAVTSVKIKNRSVGMVDLTAQVQGFLNDSIAKLSTAFVNSQAAGVAGASCPSNRIAVAASCACDDQDGARNLGVLFHCTIAGTGAVAGCFDEALTFNPNLPGPLALVSAVCLGAESTDGTPWIPTAAGLAADGVDDPDTAALDQEAGRWIPEQQAAYERALGELREKQSAHADRVRN